MPLRTLITLGAIVSAFAVADVLAPNLVPQDFSEIAALILASLLGFFSGQVTLIGMRASLYRGNVFLRLPWTAFLAVSMWYCLILGQRLADEDVIPPVLLGVSIMLGILVSQGSFWIVAQTLRWRLKPPHPRPGAEEARKQFSIQQLAVAITAAALMLALGRTILPEIKQRDLRIETFDTWVTLGLALYNLLVTVPWIWIAFADAARLRFLIPAALCITGLVTLTPYAIFGLINGWDDFFPAARVLGTLSVSQCFPVAVTCVLLRLHGFRLERCGKPA